MYTLESFFLEYFDFPQNFYDIFYDISTTFSVTFPIFIIKVYLNYNFFSTFSNSSNNAGFLGYLCFNSSIKDLAVSFPFHFISCAIFFVIFLYSHQKAKSSSSVQSHEKKELQKRCTNQKQSIIFAA